MIPWWYMIPAVFAGAAAGLMITALLSANSEKGEDGDEGKN